METHNFQLKIIRLINVSFFVMIGSMSVFAYCPYMVDDLNLPKWIFTSIICIIWIIVLSVEWLLFCNHALTLPLLASCIIFVCVSEALCGIAQWIGLLPSNCPIGISGSFDNPAGFASCLCFGLPFIWLIPLNRQKHFRWFKWVLIFILLFAIILSESRTGIISLSVLGLFFLFRRLKIIGKLVLLAFTILLFWGCYCLKKESADGRLFIWKCCVEMIKDKPLLGHGFNAFEAYYMDYQANYFEEHGEDENSMLADNVKSPFNEYLNVLLNFGFVGLLLLSFLIIWLIKCYHKNANEEKKVVVYVLMSIGVFSCFSYPFSYPFTWIILLLCIGVISEMSFMKFPKKISRYIFAVPLLLVLLSLGYFLVNRISFGVKWKYASDFAQMGEYKRALSYYENLQQIFASYPPFLYSYATVLCADKQYQKSLDIALECRRYWADYNLQLLIGDIYKNLKLFTLAEESYYSAHQMCPSRFYPLYNLYSLYKEQGDSAQMCLMANKIIVKTVKVNNPEIMIMKKIVEQEICKMKLEF